MISTPPRPCPFCGTHTPVLVYDAPALVWRVCCASPYCGAMGPAFASRDDARLHWECRITTEEGEPI
jgi:hypothetical protein